MPATHKRSFAAEELQRRKKKKPFIWFVAAIVMVALIFGGYALYHRSVSQKQVEKETQQIRSIAVLPFRDMSQEQDQDYFCEGLADDIISALSNVGSLHVLARTSSFAFKGQQKDMREIGRELEVDAVFEGSVSKSGTRLRINAQLINIADGYHIISAQYNYEMANVLDIRDDISMKIVNALKVELLGEEKAAIEKRYTDNIDAYTLYSQGRINWYKRDYEGYMNSLECYQKALEIDSTYALAYAGIADTYSLLAEYSYLSPEEAYPKAKEAVKKALVFDETLAEAYTSLAQVTFLYDWDWTRAGKEFKHAIELNPGNALTHHWYCDYLRVMGKFDEALAEIKIALGLDPLSPIKYGILSDVYNLSGRYDEAMEQCRKGLKIDPNFGLLYLRIGDIFIVKGNYKEALEAYQKALKLTKGNVYIKGSIGIAYGLSGERDKAKQILNELLEQIKYEYVPSTSIAFIYFGLGENDKGFDWLERAYDKRVPFLPFIMTDYKSNPKFTHIFRDPRYKALLKKMNLPED